MALEKDIKIKDAEVIESYKTLVHGTKIKIFLISFKFPHKLVLCYLGL